MCSSLSHPIFLLFLFFSTSAASTPFLYGRTIDLPLEFHLDESSYGDISIIGSIKPEELDHIQKWGLGLTKSSLVQRVRPETIRGVHPLNNQTVFLPEITTSTVYDGGFSTYPGVSTSPFLSTNHLSFCLFSAILLTHFSF